MLSNDQIKYLAEQAKLNIYMYEEKIIGVLNKDDFDCEVKIPYEEFKNKMELGDIRFNWLLTDNSYQAGGAVLNWVWGEQKNEDVDFFFTNEDSSKNFRILLSGYGFDETAVSNYALTCFNEEEKVIIQVIGSAILGNSFNGFVPFGSPEETIERFDIEICKFAVDGSYVYTTSKAISTLISKSIIVCEDKNNTTERILKYNRKGFFIPKLSMVSKDEWF